MDREGKARRISGRKEVHEYLKENMPELLKELIKEKERGSPVGEVVIEIQNKNP